MKTIFKRGGVPTSDFYILDKTDAREIRFSFPFVIKPTDANSSKGVFKIETEEEFKTKIEESLSFSREGKAIVEKFVSGVEIQVDCVAINGRAHILMTSDKESLENSGEELQVAGFSIPGKVCDKYKENLKKIAQCIVDSFHLENTPFFFQAICDDSNVWVLEFAPRIAGGTRFETVKMYSGYDYIKASINSFNGLPLDEQYTIPNTKYVVRHLYMKPGIFNKIEGIDELLASGVIDNYFPFVNPGREISTSLNSGNRIGAIMVQDNSYEKAIERILLAFDRIRLLDTDNIDRSYWR
jgi:biotin carboxylase